MMQRSQSMLPESLDQLLEVESASSIDGLASIARNRHSVGVLAKEEQRGDLSR